MPFASPICVTKLLSVESSACEYEIPCSPHLHSGIRARNISPGSCCCNYSEVMVTVAREVLLWDPNISHCGHYGPSRVISRSDEPGCVCLQLCLPSRWRSSLVKGRAHGGRLQQLAFICHSWEGCCPPAQGANSPRGTSREERQSLNGPLRSNTEHRRFPKIGIYWC